ncbi:MAG: hypothetical protein ACRDFX_11610 [Chloroflexota bacterium]
MVRGSWWRIFGIALLVFVITLVLESIAGAVIGALLVNGHQVWGQIASAIVAILVVPFELGVLILLYFDLRIRKEGFDIDHLTRNMDVAPPA